MESNLTSTEYGSCAVSEQLNTYLFFTSEEELGTLLIV